MALERYRDAVSDLDSALRIAPHSTMYARRGACQYALGEYSQAVADFTAGLNRNDRDAQSHFGRGMAYKMLGQVEKFREDFRRGRAIDPQWEPETD